MGQKSIEARVTTMSYQRRALSTIRQKTKTHRLYWAMGGEMKWGGGLLHKIRANQKQNIIQLGQKHFYFKGHFGTQSMCNRTHD